MPDSSGFGFDMSGIFEMLKAALLVAAVLYAYFAVILTVLANKTRTSGAWTAWIPVANMVLLCRIAGKSGVWVLLLLIPVVNLIAAAVIWARIARRCGKPEWLGALAVVPPLLFVIPPYLTFGGGAQRSALCGGCGARLPPGEGFCGECGRPAGTGSPARPVAACPVCGIACDPGETFCGNCGRSLSASSVVAVPPAAAQQGSPTAVIAVGAILMIALVAGAVWWRQQGGSITKRQRPLPPLLADLLQQLPADTDPRARAKPTSLVFQSKRASPTAEAVYGPMRVAQRLFFTVQDKVPFEVSNSMISMTYRTAPGDGPVGVSVFEVGRRSPMQDLTSSGEIIAGSISAEGPRDRLVFQTAGGSYSGWRIPQPSTRGPECAEVIVIEQRDGPFAIVIHATTERSIPVAERLAQNVGGGQVLAAYPDWRDALLSLPLSTPAEIVLESFHLTIPEDVNDGVTAATLSEVFANGRNRPPDAPLFLTDARYREGGGMPWSIHIWQYPGPKGAWPLRGTANSEIAWKAVSAAAGVAGAPVAITGGEVIGSIGKIGFRKGNHTGIVDGWPHLPVPQPFVQLLNAWQP